MSSNYVGADLFSANLDLLTDDDPLRAATWRNTLERLLDNDTYLQNRMVQRAGSSITALVTTSNTTTPRVLASVPLYPVDMVAGASYRFSATIQVARGATATACNIIMKLLVNGTQFGNALSGTLNTSNGFTGVAHFEGELTFHSAPGASAPLTVAQHFSDRIASSTLVSVEVIPDLAQTRDTTALLNVELTAEMSAAVADVSFTAVHASIQRLT